MAFAQLTYRASLRDIVACLNAVPEKMYHMGIHPVDTMDTRHFLFLQEQFVEHGVSRRYCNALMGYIRAMLKWGILRKLVPHQVYVEAKFIPPLKKGRTKARENPERQDVPDDVVRRTLPFMFPTVRVARRAACEQEIKNHSITD